MNSTVFEVARELKRIYTVKNYIISDESEVDMSGDYGCKFRLTQDNLTTKGNLTVEVTIHHRWLGENLGYFIELIGNKNNVMLDGSILISQNNLSIFKESKPVEFCENQINSIIKALECNAEVA
jgi:hypothetical protein